MLIFRRHALNVSVVVVSILILGTILLWTLNHTDIVAFVTVLLVAIGLEAVFIFTLFEIAAIPENSVSDRRAGSGIALILAKTTKLPKLVWRRQPTAGPTD
jgi:hypothetical protein